MKPLTTFRHAPPGIRALLTFAARLCDPDAEPSALVEAECAMYARHSDASMSWMSGAKTIVDLSEAPWCDKGYLFSFGAVGTTYVYVCANSIEDALEAAAAHLPKGYFVTPEYSEELDNDGTPRNADEAEADLTATESGWLTSYEWTVQDMTQGELLSFVRGDSAEYG